MIEIGWVAESDVRVAVAEGYGIYGGWEEGEG